MKLCRYSLKPGPSSVDTDWAKPPATLILDIYLHETSEFTLYEEAGVKIVFRCSQTEGRIEVSAGDSRRSYKLKLNGCSSPKEIKAWEFDMSRSVDLRASEAELDQAMEGWYYDSKNQVLMVKARAIGPLQVIVSGK